MVSGKLMPKADKFNKLYYESKRYYDEALDVIEESINVYNNKYSDKIKEKFYTKSGYVSPDTKIAIDERVEFNSANPPDYTYSATIAESVPARRDINKLIRNITQINNLDAKMMPIHLAGHVEGTGIGEVIYEDIFEEGWQIPDAATFAQINTQREAEGKSRFERPTPTKYTRKVGSGINIIPFNVIKNDIRLDPLASSFDLRGTSRWCIVKIGNFTIDDIAGMKEQYKNDPKFNFNMDQIKPITHKEDYRQRDIESREGYQRQPSISLHKIYYNNGLVDWIINREFVVAEGVINNKLVGAMPLVFYVPRPSLTMPYGRPLWAETKMSNDVKSGAINLMADLVAKNVKASLLTTSQELAMKANDDQVFNDSIVFVGNGMTENSKVTDMVTQFQVNDMTPGLISLIQTADSDIARIARTSQLTQGFQQKQVRTDGIANAMQQSANMSAAMMTRQTENTLHQPIARDILSILRNYYPEFDLQIPREAINPVMLRVRNGSSLEEDRMSRSQVLGIVKSDAQNFPLDWNITKVNEDFYETLGVPEIREYFSDPQKALIKNLMAMGMNEQQIAQAQAMLSQIGQGGQGGQSPNSSIT